MLNIRSPPIDYEYDNLKSALVYLESPECRKGLPEETRLAERREYTARFRALLALRQQQARGYTLCITAINQPFRL